MYSPQLLDHFEHPRNAGILEDPDATVQVENPACGDVLRLSAKLAGNAISEIRFQVKGCVASMACASAVAELASGRTIAALSKLTREDVVAAVGGVPEGSSHAAQLAIDSLRALLAAVTK